MADKKKPVRISKDESQESLYNRAVNKMNADRLIVQFAYKIENYLTAADMFDALGDYQDSARLAQKCRELAKKTKEDQKLSMYQKASEQKNKCITASDYEKAAEKFSALGEYKDSEKECLLCRERAEQINKKRKIKKASVITGVATLAILIVIAGYSGIFSYAKGLFYMTAEKYDRAQAIFEDLGSFLNSEETAEKCAEKILETEALEEKKNLIKAKAGKQLKFGTQKWKVLERDGDYLYLIASHIDRKSEFYKVPFHDKQEAVDWENSSLRKWLNTDVLENCFTQEERDLLIQMDTQDYVRILSEEEAGKYKDVLDTLGLNYWLRTPGNQEDTAVFMSAEHSIMEYGYPVSSDGISVRPVIMVDCSKITEEEQP